MHCLTLPIPEIVAFARYRHQHELARTSQEQQRFGMTWFYIPSVFPATPCDHPLPFWRRVSADLRSWQRARDGTTSAERALPVGIRIDLPPARPLCRIISITICTRLCKTPDSIMILSEMIHDARIVRMNAEHLPKNIRRWMGDPVGHWEGDTLVIDTTDFTGKTRFRGSTADLHVVERLRRLDARTLLYRFTIEDSNTWDRPWSGEMAWPATNQPMYEYACQEGNYALGDVLRGARLLESGAGAGKPQH